MVYRKEKPIVLKSSTSALANNLSVHVDLKSNVINYAVVHKSLVNLVSASTDGTMVNHRQVTCKEPTASTAAHSNAFVLQAKLVPTPSRTILVMTSQKGIQMYEAEGSVMLYWYALDMNRDDLCFGRGVCGVGSDTICVGTHDGSILVFDIPSRGTNISLTQTLKSHTAAICALEADGDHMISSDDLGNVIVWQTNGEHFKEKTHITGSGYPATSLGLFQEQVVVGYGSGHLRVFNCSSGALLCEATAHARWITSIDIARGSALILSVGDDSFARIWQLHPKTGELEHRHSEHIVDLQLQGGMFIGKDGRAFGCTGYDNNEILFFTQA